MPKLKPEVQTARREHILDAAERCFARAGFHRTTMHDICKEAGVSPGALYVYFDSKEALIAGISERDRAEFAERLDGARGGPRLHAGAARAGRAVFPRGAGRQATACASRSAWNPRATRASARSTSGSTATSSRASRSCSRK